MLKNIFQGDLAQKQGELDASLSKINKLEEWQKEHLQDIERKDQ